MTDEIMRIESGSQRKGCGSLRNVKVPRDLTLKLCLLIAYARIVNSLVTITTGRFELFLNVVTFNTFLIYLFYLFLS